MKYCHERELQPPGQRKARKKMQQWAVTPFGGKKKGKKVKAKNIMLTRKKKEKY